MAKILGLVYINEDDATITRYLVMDTYSNSLGIRVHIDAWNENKKKNSFVEANYYYFAKSSL